MFVIVNDYSRFTWILLRATKDEIYDIFIAFIKKLQRKIDSQLATLDLIMILNLKMRDILNSV